MSNCFMFHAPSVRLLIAVSLLLLANCDGPAKVKDPLAALHDTGRSSKVHLAAMDLLETTPPSDEYLAALHRMVWFPGFTVADREEAVARLMRLDPDGLKRTLRLQLPRMAAWEGLTRLCEIVAENGWTELSPALVSSWARPVAFVQDETDRPEYLALAQLHGGSNVPDVIFDLLLESKKVSEGFLRTRCWDLLHRLGYRDRLVIMLASADIADDDQFLLDLQAGAADLGIVPHNREEILWMRGLRKEEHRAFWDEMIAAVSQLSERRRSALEMRDLPIVVAAARHEPELLSMSESAMYDRLDDRLRGRRHHSHGSNYNNFNVGRRERLHDWRGELTWGDLAALTLVLNAIDVPQIVNHLFDFADRDQRDLSTEYGGVIALDEKGRYEIIEFVPRVREHDRKFLASQSMFDAGYTALFQFHFHAQKNRNEEFAGPGYGDVNYAEKTRANCLVFTFVNDHTMNVDFYRHHGVLIDLGEIGRNTPDPRG